MQTNQLKQTLKIKNNKQNSKPAKTTTINQQIKQRKQNDNTTKPTNKSTNKPTINE